MGKAHILEEIRRSAQANGGVPLGQDRFRAETGIRPADWFGRYWVRWGDAVREAGFSANTLTKPHDEGRLVESLVALTRELGRFPVKGDLLLKRRSDPSFPSHNTFNRLGSSKAKRAAKVLVHCRAREGLEDIAELCAGIASRDDEATPDAPDSSDVIAGFVYLLKSGRYYKIGKTNAAGRRERELAIQLPEKARTVHVIRTDDPAGIEAYWHRRFEPSRKNGEWFELTAADVAAFKRRKFM